MNIIANLYKWSAISTLSSGIATVILIGLFTLFGGPIMVLNIFVAIMLVSFGIFFISGTIIIIKFIAEE